VLGAAAGAQRRDPLALDLQRRDRLLDHLDPVPLGHLALLRVELQAPPQRQQRDVVRVGAGHKGDLAQPVRAVADHRDPAVARLVAVADRAVADQPPTDGVGRSGSSGSVSTAPVASRRARAGRGRLCARTYSDDVTLLTLGRRLELDPEQREVAERHRIKVVEEPVAALEVQGERIAALRTGGGAEHRFDAPLAVPRRSCRSRSGLDPSRRGSLSMGMGRRLRDSQARAAHGSVSV
jgi:hypothetical protein